MRALRRLEAIPPALPLALIVVLATIPTIDYALGLASYFVMPDELGYVRQAIEIGESFFLLTPGDNWFHSWAQLQPLIDAPPYALFDTPTAFDVAHAINAVVMASVAVPAYLLARPLVPSRIWAYAVAALSVAVPWLVMAGSLMQEVSAYPVFTWAIFAMHRAVARPSIGRDVLALALIGLAFFSRAQFAVLGPIFLAAIVIHELSYGTRADPAGGAAERARRALRRSVVMHPAAVLAAVAGLAGAALLGIDTLLGSYRSVGRGELFPPGTFDSARETLAFIVAGIGILPLVAAAAWAAVSLWRPESPERHAFAVLLVLVVPVVTVLAGSFTVQFAAGINDRYLFYIAPMLFAGMVAGLTSGRRVAIPLAVAGALVAWLLEASVLGQAGPSVASPSATFHLVLDGRAYQVGEAIGNPQLSSSTLLAVLTLGGAVVLAAALRFLPATPVAAVATLAVLVFGVLETGYVLDKVGATQAGVSQAFVENRNWVDETLPEGARAAAVVGAFEDPGTTAAVFWDLSFWNRKVDRGVLRWGDPTYEQPLQGRFSFNPATGELNGLDHRAYLVRADGDVRFGLRGAEVIDTRNLLHLVRAPRPYEVAWAVVGAGDRGRVPGGETVRIRVYGNGEPGVRSVGVTLTTSFDAIEAHRYELTGGGVEERGRVAPGETAQLNARLRVPPTGHADLVLEVPVRGEAPENGPGLRVTSVQLG